MFDIDYFKQTLLDCEKPCWNKLGKSVVAACDLKVGEVLSWAKVNVKVSHQHQRGTPGHDDEEELFPHVLDQMMNQGVVRLASSRCKDDIITRRHLSSTL